MGALPKFERQTRNAVKLADDLASRREIWQSRPYNLEFATNNVCNLRCVMCPQHDGVPVQKVESEFAAGILDQFLPEGGVLSPLALSEPLAGDIDLYLRKCEEHDAYINLITNATLFTEERLQRLLPRVERMWISFESPRPEIYESLRIGASFAKTVEKCRLAARLARAHLVPVSFVTILMEPVWRDLPEYIRFVHDLGGQAVHVLELLPNYPRFENHRVVGKVPMSELVACRDEAAAQAASSGIALKFEMPPPLGMDSPGAPPALRLIYPELIYRLHGEILRQNGHFCHQAASYMKVDTDGTVYPCCRAPAELRMGNAHEQSLGEIWNGPKYRDLRRRFHSGDLPAPCRGCTGLEGPAHNRRPEDTIPGDGAPWGTKTTHS